MNRLATLALAGALLAGCSIGAPPGFSGGDSWTFPLVGPLEDGLLITPVFVNDKGPYLMAIDPDSPVSVVDQGIVSELELHNGIGPKVLDETDTNRSSMMAEVLSFKLGALTVRNRPVMVMKIGSFNPSGRQLRGILGRDVIADSLVFGFDRDRGVGYLATQKGFTPPTNATVMDYDIITNRLAVQIQPAGRRVAKVKIGDRSYKLHLDLGAVTSQLRRGLWEKAGLAVVPVASELRDEAGTVQHTTEAGVANQVVTGEYSASGVLFAPYSDKRWEEEFIDGTLGLNFFRTLNVFANWDAEKYYLVPRGDLLATAAERVQRWGSDTLAKCVNVGCVELQLLEPNAGTGAEREPAAPPLPPGSPGQASGAPGASAAPGAGAPAVMPPPPPEARPVLVLSREPQAAGIDLELLLVAVGADGAASELPRLVVNLPASQSQLSNQLDPSYSGFKIVVVDVSPYPRQCGKPGSACIQALASSH